MRRGVRGGVTTAALAAIAVLVALPAGGDAQVPADGPLQIYSSLPLRGDLRPETVSAARGMKLAVADHGGRAGGRDIAYVSLDDATAAAGRWDPEQVEVNARRAADDARAIGYLGEFNSGASAISMPILNQAGIPQISPSNTYVGLTRGGAGSFTGEPGMYFPSGTRTYARVAPADHLQAQAIVTYLKTLKVRRLVILHDSEVYGGGLARLVRTAAARAGIAIVAFRAYDPRARRYRVSQIVKGRGFDGFFCGCLTQNNAARLFRDAHSARPKAKLLGPDGVAESTFARALDGGTAKRTYVTNPTYDPAAYPAAAQDVMRRYRETYRAEPEAYGIYGYEAMALLLDAMDRAAAGAGGLSRDSVVREIFATRDRASVLGTYSIDANGDTTLREYGGYRVRGGNLVFDRVLRSG